MTELHACSATNDMPLERELSGRAVHLYFCYPEKIDDPNLIDRYHGLLSEPEREQQCRFHSPRSRHQYLLTRALLRCSLSGYFPVKPADWQFSRNGYGKPDLAAAHETLQLQFNISHTNGLIVCGITLLGKIGVDVEDSDRPMSAGPDQLSSYFSSEEAAELRALPIDKQKQRFFDYWTLKESFIKARGEGMAIPLQQFSFSFRNDVLAGFSVHDSLLEDALDWQFRRASLAGQYRIALALKSRAQEIELETFLSVPLQSTQPIALNFA